MTSAPACANILTAAAPMPREPPVISAALPASEIMMPPKCPEENEQRNSKCGTLGLLYDRIVSAPGRGDEIANEPFRKSVAHHPLGMPLHAHHPVRVARPLDTLNGAVA